MKYLVDANVLSEPTKPQPDAKVVHWLRQHEPHLVINPIVVGELKYGILLLAAGRKRTRLMSWFTQGVSRIRVVDFDATTADVWAQLLAKLKTSGTAMSVKDSLIAATALRHRLTLVTRNTKDFAPSKVTVLDPF